MADFTRSAPLGDVDRTGRTLEGMAFRWDNPERVSDGGAPYLEEFARGCCNKTVGDRGGEGGRPWPLGVLHPWAPGARTSPVPIGAVHFIRADDGLMFRAVVSETQAGDEALALVTDGAMSDVSVGGRPFKHQWIARAADRVLRRTEIGLLELSLAPTGMAQRGDAELMAVRAEQAETGTPMLDEYRRRALLL